MHRRARGRAFSEDEEAVEDVEVHVVEGAEEAPSSPTAPPASPLDDTFAGLVDFAVAGAQVSGEFRCADCGYGAVVQHALPPCPMCGGTVWETRAARAAD